jgi:uncharacterized protein (TIGR03067 family)
MKLRLIPALCVVVLLAADKKEEPKDELEGTWVPVSCVVNGWKDPGAPFSPKIIFSNGEGTLTSDDKVELSFTYKLDNSQRPKTIEVTWFEGALRKKKVAKSIFEIDGDTLRICTYRARGDLRPPLKDKSEKGSNYENDRFAEDSVPTNFESERGSCRTLLNYKREKK